MLSVSCSEYIIDTEFKFMPAFGRIIAILYSKSEYKKFKFKLEHIHKMIDGMKNKTINLKHMSYSITNLLNNNTK